MKITIVPSSEIILLPPQATAARLWEGTTDKGTRVLVYVAAVAVPDLTCDDAEMAELVEFTGCEQPVLYITETEFTS